MGLGGDDAGGGHGAGVEEDADEGEGHGDFVGDDLGAGAESAQEGVGGSGGPAGEDDAVDADGGDGQDVEDGYGQVGELQGGAVAEDGDDGAQGDDGEGHDGGDDGDDGGEQVDGFVDAGGGEAFFEGEFDAVDQGLEQSVGADPVGAVSHLHAAQDLPLRQDRHQHGQQKENEDGDRLTDHQPPGVRTERRHDRTPICTIAPGATPSC